MNLTPHFTLDELTSSEAAERNGWDNTPNETELANLKRLATFLEEVKTALGGRPVMVNSAFRNKQVNDSVGSKDTSQHRIGCAVDIRVPQLTPDQVVKAIVAAGLEYDQLIREFDYKIKDKRHDAGFIAQEYQQVIPWQVDSDANVGGEVAALTSGEPVLGIQQNLVPYLVAAIKELKSELDSVKAELATLKGN